MTHWWKRIWLKNGDMYKAGEEAKKKAQQQQQPQQPVPKKAKPTQPAPAPQPQPMAPPRPKVEEPPSTHEWMMEKTDIGEVYDPSKVKQRDPITWIIVGYFLVLIIGGEALQILMMLSFATWTPIPLTPILAIGGLMLGSFIGLTSVFLYRRHFRALEYWGTKRVAFRFNSLLDYSFYEGVITKLKKEYPTPGFSTEDIKKIQWNCLLGTKEKPLIEDIEKTFHWILDKDRPLTSWTMPFVDEGYYRDSKGIAIKNCIEFWVKGVGLGHSYSRWGDFWQNTGYGWAKTESIGFELMDMGWRKGIIRDEDTGEPVTAWWPVFLIGSMPFYLRDYLRGASTEKIMKTCEALPTVDHQQQRITSLEVAVARGNEQLRRTGTLDRSTWGVPQVMDTIQHTGNPTPATNETPQPSNPESSPVPHVNWSFVGFFVTAIFLGLLSFLVFILHVL